MNWYVVDKKYINYLTQFDSHVGYVEYGERVTYSHHLNLTILKWGASCSIAL